MQDPFGDAVRAALARRHARKRRASADLAKAQKPTTVVVLPGSSALYPIDLNPRTWRGPAGTFPPGHPRHQPIHLLAAAAPRPAAPAAQRPAARPQPAAAPAPRAFNIARLRSVARNRLADLPRLATASARQKAVEKKRTIPPEAEIARDNLRAGLRLASIIPAYALQEILETNDLSAWSTDDIIDAVVDLVTAKHQWQYVWQSCAVWAQLLASMDKRGVQHEERARAPDVNRFLKESATAATAAAPMLAPAVALHMVTSNAPPAARTRDGTSAAAGKLAHLRSLDSEYFFDVSTDKKIVRPPAVQGLAKVRQSAPEPAIEILRRFQRLAADKSKSRFARNVAFGCCLMGFGVLRSVQAQHFGVLYYFEYNGQTILLGKTKKKVQGATLETFICPLGGVLNDEQWFWSCLTDTLDSLPGGFSRFAFRDYASPRGKANDPYAAVSFNNNAMSPKKIDLSIQRLLEVECGMSPEIAKRYTKHSFKRFLIAISNAADSSADARTTELELGRWSQSTLSRNPRIAPADLQAGKFLISATSVSRVYAMNDTMTKLVALACKQLERARRAADAGPLPIFRGWDRVMGL